MPIALSINLNKIALIRNSRPGNNPYISRYAQRCIAAGVDGLTVHPRPDQRHIRADDCDVLAKLVRAHNNQQTQKTGKKIELNIEGNPFAGCTPSSRDDVADYPGFVAIVERTQPDQVTLVPDSSQQLTSDHGFDLHGDNRQLAALIQSLKQTGARVSLFMDPEPEQISRARDIGADRIELYTGPFAEQFEHAPGDIHTLFNQHCNAAEHAHAIGLGLNAGHDLNLDNLPCYAALPYLQEVSIGHALTIDALDMGIDAAIDRYLALLS